MAFMAVSGLTLENAIKSTNAVEWQWAITNEYNQLINKSMFEEINSLPLEK